MRALDAHMSYYGTFRKTGVDDIYGRISPFVNDDTVKGWIERGRPDRQFSPWNMSYFCWIDQKAGEFDKNDPNHYIILPAKQFVIFVRYYNSPDIPVIYLDYSKETKDWYVFSIDSALECIDHIKLTSKGERANDMAFLYQQLPVLFYKKYPIRKTKPQRKNASWYSMIALDYRKLEKRMIKDLDWVKKLPIV